MNKQDPHVFPDFTNPQHMQVLKGIYGQLPPGQINAFQEKLQGCFVKDSSVVRERKIIYALLSLTTLQVKDPDVEEWRRRIRLEPVLVGHLMQLAFTSPVLIPAVKPLPSGGFNPIEIVHYLSEEVQSSRHLYTDDTVGQIGQAMALIELFDNAIGGLSKARAELCSTLQALPLDGVAKQVIDNALAALNDRSNKK